ncbi:hypothetical protein BDV96DRAFT_647066 [Lophiotrema nucula]|uniref:Calcofluor white hypersensitive protein n=1 Tax=Lophiotrema nucula TaxID=690887 RepID=A0A6A5Z7K6_9PLEO|nr:hypothetical protein BDV96DRAFT_647066 [Lophiotrema nucula]
MSRRALTFGGLGAAGVAGYYLYSAGGDPKVAEKKLEHDAATATRKLKGDLPGRDKEAKKGAEEGWEHVKSSAADIRDSAKTEAQRAEAKLEQARLDASKKFEETRQETGKQLQGAVDKFDKKVTEGASKSQSWIGGWFGGK